jgi:phosphocarrier protein
MSEAPDSVHSIFEVKNQYGLHARPAALLVELASTFNSEILVEKEGDIVNGKSLMGLLMLSAGCGSVVKVLAKGPDAQCALAAIADLFHRRFDED